MKEVEIRKYYKKKIDELKNHNKLYFEKSSPKISDGQYDKTTNWMSFNNKNRKVHFNWIVKRVTTRLSR